jgi:hypothetical protein
VHLPVAVQLAEAVRSALIGRAPPTTAGRSRGAGSDAVDMRAAVAT